MLQKIKDFWNNPYAAPLTQPLRNIGNAVAKSVSLYTYAVKNAFDDRYLSEYEKKKSRFARIFSNLYRDEIFAIGNGLAAVIVGGAAATAAGVATFGSMAAAGAAAKIAATGVAAVAAGTVGIVAAPVLTVAVVGAVAVVAGTVLGGVPGIVGGAVKAYKHHQNLKNPPPAPAQAAAAQPTAKAIQDATVLRICDDFRTLPAQTQQAVIERLERSASAPQTPQQKMIKAIDGMTEEQRVTLAEMLEEKLASAFDTVASKRAAEAGTLDEDISVKPIATKLRRRNAAPAGGAA
ncbi:MAG TPA: hypothetical protein PLX33_07735 [Alphaproteobacteria bacterium]|nr:hypothetical protein [Alphaproteobacteria bacterium]